MQPSEGMPGVILQGSECRRALAALQLYPTTINAGPDKDISSSLERMKQTEEYAGRLTYFTLPAETAIKLGTYITEQVKADESKAIKGVIDATSMVMGANIIPSILSARQRRFGRHLVEMSQYSYRIAHEQIVPKR